MKVKIYNRQKIYKIDVARLKKIVKFIIKNELSVSPFASILNLSSDQKEFLVYVLDENRMINLNLETFGKQTPTDVISFSYLDQEFMFDEEFVIGEIFISLEQAAKVFKKYKTNINYEFLLYVVHGILHVFEYDDDTKNNIQIMREREKFYMDILSMLPGIIILK